MLSTLHAECHTQSPIGAIDTKSVFTLSVVALFVQKAMRASMMTFSIMTLSIMIKIRHSTVSITLC
jgi:hypothetical protein